MKDKKTKRRFTNVIWEASEAELPVVLLLRMKLEGEQVTTQPEAVKLAARRYLQQLDQQASIKEDAKALPQQTQPVFADSKSAENYRLIVAAYLSACPNGEPPNYSQLSRTTGLHRKTAKRHLEKYFEHSAQAGNGEGRSTEKVSDVGF